MNAHETDIQDEAVEAAAAAHLEVRGETTWGALTKQGRESRLYWMRAALEAAMPFLERTTEESK